MTEEAVSYAIFKPNDPVKWKSGIGYTYEGVIVKYIPDSDDYEILTPSGATAIVDRELVEPNAPAAEKALDESLTPEQRAAHVREAAGAQIRQGVVDATMVAFSTLREGLPDEADTDELRLEAARMVVGVAEDVQVQITQQVAAKRAKS